jgi:hypothetical protein
MHTSRTNPNSGPPSALSQWEALVKRTRETSAYVAAFAAAVPKTPVTPDVTGVTDRTRTRTTATPAVASTVESGMTWEPI